MNERTVLLFIIFILAAGSMFAQTPAISALENNYSYIAPGLPNYGIAQGSIFDIFGSNLANSKTGLQSAPLQTTLNGVTVSVTVNGTTAQVYLYYVTPTQIGGILPSSVPVGTGQIIVNNNGMMSPPAPIMVVQSAFGILTLNNGSGPAAAFDSKYNYLGASNAANPGEAILLWGTGLGPVPDDMKQSAVSVPIEVDIGGVAAKVLYAGRSQFPGLDQINVIVPQVSSGCYVSVVVRSGNIVSNFSSMPVTATGRTCSDETTGLGISPTQLGSLTPGSTVTVAGLTLFKDHINTPAIVVGGITVEQANNYEIDEGSASFEKVTIPQNYNPYTYLGSTNSAISIGSCLLYTVTYNTATTTPPTTPTTTLPTTTVVNLNAGPQINVTGPNGTMSMPYNNGTYSAQLGGGTGPTALPVFIPDTGGTFTFDNGSGGPDVGAFKVSLPFEGVTWTNMSSFSTVQRSAGATVTWTGGASGTYVDISGSSQTSAGTTYIFGFFNCIAPASAQQFTVPGAVLLALPPTGSLTEGGVTVPLSGSLGVASYSNLTSISIPGIQYAFAFTSSTSSTSVTYQ